MCLSCIEGNGHVELFMEIKILHKNNDETLKAICKFP